MNNSVVIEKDIRASIERVFATATNFANAPETFPAIKRVEVLTSGPLRIGTRFKESDEHFVAAVDEDGGGAVR